jgi:ribosome biogenesis GTP-binding protein YsxC/EngB
MPCTFPARVCFYRPEPCGQVFAHQYAYGNKNLAKTSGTPGKTQLINHFLVNNSWYMADLPGYGFAKVSKSQKKDLKNIISDYLLKRKNLMTVFVLIDIRHKPLANDLQFMAWLGTGKTRIPLPSLCLTQWPATS